MSLELLCLQYKRDMYCVLFMCYTIEIRSYTHTYMQLGTPLKKSKGNIKKIVFLCPYSGTSHFIIQVCIYKNKIHIVHLTLIRVWYTLCFCPVAPDNRLMPINRDNVDNHEYSHMSFNFVRYLHPYTYTYMYVDRDDLTWSNFKDY